MFLGCYDHLLDDKGRTSLPKDFREQLAGSKGAPYLTALRDCLAIYPADEFEAFLGRLSTASSTVESVQRMQRLMTGMAVRCPFDKQGRINIPQKLQEWAHLERELVFTGVGNRIELWDRSRHMAELERAREGYGAFSTDLKDFGL